MLKYIQSKFKSKHDYARVAIAILIPPLALYGHMGGDVEDLIAKYTTYALAATNIVALITRSPLDDKPQQ